MSKSYADQLKASMPQAALAPEDQMVRCREQAIDYIVQWKQGGVSRWLDRRFEGYPARSFSLLASFASILAFLPVMLEGFSMGRYRFQFETDGAKLLFFLAPLVVCGVFMGVASYFGGMAKRQKAHTTLASLSDEHLLGALKEFGKITDQVERDVAMAKSVGYWTAYWNDEFAYRNRYFRSPYNPY